MTPYLILAGFLLLLTPAVVSTGLLLLVVRRLRRDAEDADLLLELRGRMIVINETLESRAAVVAVEIGTGAALAGLESAPGLENWRLN